MKLHFDRAGFDRLVAHSKAAPKNSPLYGDKESAQPGLWLVGDEGVYLMSNGDPALLDNPEDTTSTKNFVVYAKEVDPTKLEFDEWWNAKNRSFGGDDGCDFLPLEAFSDIPPGDVILDVNSKGIAIIKLKKAKKKVASA